jgi:glycosyltransferase 2 family protein
VAIFLGIPLSAVFLWLAIRNADLDLAWTVVTGADVVLLALAVVVMAAVYAGQAIRWSAIAKTPRVSRAGFVEMVISGAAVNNVLPGRIGDLLRARWLRVRAQIAGGRALATVFVDRAYDLVVLVFLLLVSLPFVADAEWLTQIVVASLALAAGVAAILIGARLYTRRESSRPGQSGLVRTVLRDTVEGLSEPLGRKRAGALVAVSLLVWALCSVAVWLVAFSTDITLSPVEALFVAAVLNLGVAIPSAPGFIGTYQLLGVSALAVLGVANEEALAFALVMHAVWYVPTTVIGGALLVRRLFQRIAVTAGAVPTQETRDANGR